jgi:hypothetical protein
VISGFRMGPALFWGITQLVVHNFLPKVQDKLSVAFFDSRLLKTGPVGFPETSVRNYHYILRNATEEREISSHRTLNFYAYSRALLLAFSALV